MKKTLWISLFLISGLLALFLVTKPNSLTYAEAQSAIKQLDEQSDVELIETKSFDLQRECGSRIERRIREFLDLTIREVPCRIEDHYFRDSMGKFTVQLDQAEHHLGIIVYTKKERGMPSATTLDVLRERFPSADFVTLP